VVGTLAPVATGTVTPDPDTWHAARLIPTAGIKGQEEQERRATSCLLAVAAAVPEFGRALFAEAGAPRGRIATFTEVQLKNPDGKLSIPDGVAVVERGKTTWRCLIEVKTSNAPLKPEQVNRYLDMARLHNFDAVLTISNQITASPQECPVDVDKRKTRSVDLRHLSWWRIVTEAVVQHRHRGVSDPDQAWILGELIAYMDHEASGAGGFQDMGDKWVGVRNAAREGTLRVADAGAREIADRWEQFLEYLCLGLSQDLGREVRVGRRRAPNERIEGVVKQLAETGSLSGSFRVPDAVGPITVDADLRTQRMTASVTVDAPQEGRPQTRINWMLRQLREAPDDLRLDVSFTNARETSSALLRDVREQPNLLLSAADPKREPRAFVLALARPMGTKRGKGERSFVRETRQQAVDFYRGIVQNLRAWQPSAPKLPEEPEEKVPETPVPEPPPFSTEDRDVGEAADPASVISGERPEAERF
jgi:hypothetical protein